MRLHHVGIIVDDIDKYFALHFDNELAAGQLTGPVYDPLQDSYLALVEMESGSAIELITPASDNSPVKFSSKNGAEIHHLCYEVSQLGQTMERLRTRGMLPVSGPDPAVLFDGREVGFMSSRSGGLVEFVEEAE